jgi:hypothetical protein
MKTLKNAWNWFVEVNPLTLLFGMDVGVALMVIVLCLGTLLQWAWGAVAK